MVWADVQRAKLLPQAIAGWFELDEVRMKSCGAFDLFWCLRAANVGYRAD
jgi:hypothetical protein